MDVGDLLREARRRAGMNQRVLAERAGTHKSAISRLESGTVSPTFATLEQLLRVCGLQLRVELEPLMAEVDARVDAMLAGEVSLDPKDLPRLIRTLEDRPDDDRHPVFGSPPHREGPVEWAFDGATALQLHGFAVESQAATIVAVWGDAARWWLRGINAMGFDLRGQAVSWLSGSDNQVREAMRKPVYSLVTWVQVRFVEALPPVLRVSLPWYEDPVPVVSVDEVEQSWPVHSEVLRRWRERRAA